MTSDVAGTSRLRDDIESLHEEARQITGGLDSPTIKHLTEHDADELAEGYAPTAAWTRPGPALAA